LVLRKHLVTYAERRKRRERSSLKKKYKKDREGLALNTYASHDSKKVLVVQFMNIQTL
jgi:hypothetical protein